MRVEVCAHVLRGIQEMLLHRANRALLMAHGPLLGVRLRPPHFHVRLLVDSGSQEVQDLLRRAAEVLRDVPGLLSGTVLLYHWTPV